MLPLIILKYKNNLLKIILALLVLFICLPINAVYADGARLSTTKVGEVARFTAEIPTDPCGKHKTGATSDREVVGFSFSIFPLNDKGYVSIKQGKPLRVDVSQATVSEIYIKGQKITDYHEDMERYSVSNGADFIAMSRDYDLNSSTTFTPQDTASIVVDNVKILEAGPVKMSFSLLEPKGVFCLGSGWTVIDIGQSISTPTVALNTPITTKSVAIPTEKLDITEQPPISLNPTGGTSDHKTEPSTNKSIIEVIIDWIRNIFS